MAVTTAKLKLSNDTVDITKPLNAKQNDFKMRPSYCEDGCSDIQIKEQITNACATQVDRMNWLSRFYTIYHVNFLLPFMPQTHHLYLASIALTLHHIKDHESCKMRHDHDQKSKRYIASSNGICGWNGRGRCLLHRVGSW